MSNLYALYINLKQVYKIKKEREKEEEKKQKESSLKKEKGWIGKQSDAEHQKKHFNWAHKHGKKSRRSRGRVEGYRKKKKYSLLINKKLNIS